MATDFFDREARAQKQTRLLIWLFGLAVLVVVALVYVVLASVIWAFQHPLFDRAWWNPMTLLIILDVFSLGEALVHPIHYLAMTMEPLALTTCCGSRSARCFRLEPAASTKSGCSPTAARRSRNCSAVGKSNPAPPTPMNDACATSSCEMAIARLREWPSRKFTCSIASAASTPSPPATRDDVAIGVTFGCLKLLTRDELQRRPSPTSSATSSTATQCTAQHAPDGAGRTD